MRTLSGREQGTRLRPTAMRKPLAELFLRLCDENAKLALRDGRENPVLSVRLHPSIPQALEIITRCPCSQKAKEPGVIRWLVRREIQRNRLS